MRRSILDSYVFLGPKVRFFLWEYVTHRFRTLSSCFDYINAVLGCVWKQFCVVVCCWKETETCVHMACYRHFTRPCAGARVSMTVSGANLTDESRIPWGMGLHTCLWGIILITLTDKRRFDCEQLCPPRVDCGLAETGQWTEHWVGNFHCSPALDYGRDE